MSADASRLSLAQRFNCAPEMLKHHILFRPRLQAIYYRNQKVANSTLVAALINSEHRSDSIVSRDAKLKAAKILRNHLELIVKAMYDSAFFRFSFVRNPYSRVVSCYLDKIALRPGRLLKEPMFRAELGLPVNVEVSLTEFLRAIAAQSPKEMNRHWRPQSLQIPPPVDFVGRLEQFDNDFAKVADRLGMAVSQVPRRGPRPTHADLLCADLIKPEDKALIDRIFADDFERFGYAKKLPAGALR